MTADDFGFSHGVNQAILRAHREGIVTSTSLMVTGDAATEAVAIARANPDLAVGLHLVVVSGRAALPPQEIPALADERGLFRGGPVGIGLRYQFSRAARTQLSREIREQLVRFRETGLPLSHVDGHLHMHLHPVVLSCLLELSEEFGITTIRLPREELGWNLAFDPRSAARKVVWSAIFGRLRRHAGSKLSPTGIAASDRVYGLLQTGRISEAYLLDLLPRLASSTDSLGDVEIYAHPDASPSGEPGMPLNGPPGAGERELEALLSPRVRKAVEDAGFMLADNAASSSPGPLARPALAASPGRPS
ncbi:MAG TPA: hopanoid biosynthesis-associated protein HpnK [Thermoanaerobaculia bacterium]